MTGLVKDLPGEITCPGPGGDLVEFDSPPTVTVRRDSTGDEILTNAATTEDDGVFKATVPAVDTPDGLIAAWKGEINSHPAEVTTRHEVYGRHIIGIRGILEELDRVGQAPIATAEEIQEKRDLAENRMEDACGVAFRPRYARATVEGRGRPNLLMPRPRLLEVISIDGEPVTVPPNIAGEIRSERRWTGIYEVAWIHGYETPPASVTAAVRQLTVHYLLVDPDDLDGRATFKSNEIASWALVTPGVKGARFPIPEVNEVVSEFAYIGGIG